MYVRAMGIHCQRFSNHSAPRFTDEEVLTRYLFGLLEDQKFKVKDIHSHILKYGSSWFPALPSYGQFNKRLNALSAVFSVLVERIIQLADYSPLPSVALDNPLNRSLIGSTSKPKSNMLPG
jgi:hypothetical protein